MRVYKNVLKKIMTMVLSIAMISISFSGVDKVYATATILQPGDMAVLGFNARSALGLKSPFII